MRGKVRAKFKGLVVADIYQELPCSVTIQV